MANNHEISKHVPHSVLYLVQYGFMKYEITLLYFAYATFLTMVLINAKQINSGSSLESLGTLIAGVPSQSIDNIPASELFSLSQSSAFVSNMLAAPTVVQQTFVQKVQVDFSLYLNIAAIADLRLC